MKRYRVLPIDFDARAYWLTKPANAWTEEVKKNHELNRQKVESELIAEFGQLNGPQKVKNFADLGPKPVSVLAFHNRFLHQIRTAFVIGAYFPSLTGACSLGERILNHLVLALREEFMTTPEYKRVYNKESFDDWDLAIGTLEAWGVLLPEVVPEFRSLKDRRNDALHFRAETDTNDRPLALAAIKNLCLIIEKQFPGFGTQPWFITGVPGESYIKKNWEVKPFIKTVYLQSCRLVGPNHEVLEVLPWRLRDSTAYAIHEITDEEFCSLRQSFIAHIVGGQNGVASHSGRNDR